MPKKCFVTACTSGNEGDLKTRKEKGLPPLSQFHPPKDKLDDWRRRIPRKDRTLSLQDTVCELHFYPSQFEEQCEELRMPDGKIIKLERKKKKLKPDAVPEIFPNLPKYLTRKVPKPRNPKARYTTDKNSRTSLESKNIQDFQTQEPPPLPENPPPDQNSLFEESNCDVSKEIQNNPQRIRLPNKMWSVYQDEERTTFGHLNNDHKTIDKTITFKKGILNPEVHFNQSPVNIPCNLQTIADLHSFISNLDKLRLCPGSGLNNERHKRCEQFLSPSNPNKTRCSKCANLRKNTLKMVRRAVKITQIKAKVRKRKNAHVRRLTTKVQKMNEELKECHNKMRNMKEAAIKELFEHEVFKDMAEKHRLAVEACIMAARVKNSKSRRYKYEWLYECMLLRIKSAKLYKKMLRDNLLPLPSLRTLQRYIKRLKPAFGFHAPTFKLMEKKSKVLTEAQRHGALLIDEMALDEGIHFDKSNMEILGFVDLGNASPKDADSTLGDHALVLIFQPFQGQWLQAIGAFCSRGAAKGPQLEKITTEAILMLEKHGYYVDEVTTDGGSWNRNMWSLFGIDEHNFSCRHPTALFREEDEDDDNECENLTNAVSSENERQLYFCSDFPHLVKSIWSRIRTCDILETPDGEVKMDHWRAVVKNDNVLLKQINNCWKLTEDHLNPTNYQTMNVNMAFQFFSEDVANAMEHYRDKEQVPELQDCQATVSFIRTVHNLIKAMNSKDAWDGLSMDEGNKSKEAIEYFIDFLLKWKKGTKREDRRLAWQTHLGLMVTLKGTLNLTKYLAMKVGFRYLMTRRLNQDALEHFFGNIRASCGCNDHPDPKQFVQVFRLLQTASLIKPPRGSNVTGGEMLESLTTLQDMIEETNKEKRIQLEEILDKILDTGDSEGENVIEKHLKVVGNHAQNSDHPYQFNCTIDEYAFEMFAGYVARKARSFSIAKKCEECFQSLLKPNDQPLKDTQYLIEKRSRGYLLIPSNSLSSLLHEVESCLLTVFSRSTMHRHILLEVMNEIKDLDLREKVGCAQHQQELSKAILNFFINTRMHFACKRYMNKISAARSKKKRAKAMLKLMKLNAAGGHSQEGVPLDQIQPKRKQKNTTKKPIPANQNDKPKTPGIETEVVWEDLDINWEDIPLDNPEPPGLTPQQEGVPAEQVQKIKSKKTAPKPRERKKKDNEKQKHTESTITSKPRERKKKDNEKQKHTESTITSKRKIQENKEPVKLDEGLRRSKRARSTPSWQIQDYVLE